MHQLQELLRQRVAAGLKRSAVRVCSQWATQYREMGQPYPGRWGFKYHPWLRQMHDDDSELVVGQKAAQMGYTEWLLNRTFYAIDVQGESVLYILPSDSDASDFSASRFDPALQASKHLSNLFSDVRNVGHKRAGTANLFVRGSRSRSKLKSLPVSGIVFDEVDEMVQDNIPLAMERTSGQRNQWYRKISTPTIEGHGINVDFENSCQYHFFFKCPHCSRFIELVYPDSLVITADSVTDPRIHDTYIKCTKCNHPLDHKSKPDYLASGIHIPTYSDREIKGYHVSQLYSCVMPPSKLAISYLNGLSRLADEQEFFNSKLGLPHTPKGGKISDKQITELQASYQQTSYPDRIAKKKIRTMGTDVGTHLHTIIYEWDIYQQYGNVDINTVAIPRLIAEIKQPDFEHLDTLLRQYQIHYHVIDANPERRKALEHAQRCEGFVKLCFYGNGLTGHKINIHDESLHTITVDRTSWLDTALGRFHTNKIKLPIDLSQEYRQHLQSPARIYRKDKDGNPVASYVHTGDDHYAHATNYAEIALQLAASFAYNQSIGSPL